MDSLPVTVLMLLDQVVPLPRHPSLICSLKSHLNPLHTSTNVPLLKSPTLLVHTIPPVTQCSSLVLPNLTVSQGQLVQSALHFAPPPTPPRPVYNPEAAEPQGRACWFLKRWDALQTQSLSLMLTLDANLSFPSLIFYQPIPKLSSSAYQSHGFCCIYICFI
jgi:hypothetical protein